MGLIDWGVLRPLSLAGGFDAIGEAVAARRAAEQQQRNFDANQRYLARQDAGVNARHASEQAFRMSQLAAQQEHNAAENQLARRKLATEADKSIAGVLPQAQEKLAARDFGGAWSLLGPLGGGFLPALPTRGQWTAPEGPRPETPDESQTLWDAQSLAEEEALDREQVERFEQNPAYDIVLPSGRQIRYAPEESRQAAKAYGERIAGDLAGSLGPLGSPFLGQGLGAAKAFAATGVTDPKTLAKTALDRAQHLEDQKNADRRAAATAARAAQAGGHKESTEGVAAFNALRGAVKDWSNERGVDKDIGTWRDMSDAYGMLSSGNPKLHQDAIFRYARGVAGPGAFTDAEQKNLIGRTGGSWEQVVNTLTRAANGDYSPETVKVFREAVKVKMASSQARVSGHHQAFSRSFRRGATWSAMQPNVYDMEQGLFGDLPFVQLEEADDDGGGVVIGTQRSRAAAAKAPRSGSAPGGAQGSPATDPRVEGARAWLASPEAQANPEKAAKVRAKLAAMGVR